MPDFRIQHSVLLRHPRPDVFEFFFRAENLNVLTPPWLHFSVLTPLPIDMGVSNSYRSSTLWLTEDVASRKSMSDRGHPTDPIGPSPLARTKPANLARNSRRNNRRMCSAATGWT